MRSRYVHLAILIPVVNLLSLAGCVGSPSKDPNFYTLTSATDTMQRTVSVEQRVSPALAVGPVILPEYLQRPQIVARSEDSQLQIAEFERWAGSLKSQIEAALVMGLSAELKDLTVIGYRQSWAKPLYRVTLEVEELLGRLGGTLEMTVSWVLIDSTGEEEKRNLFGSQIRVPVAGTDYLALVAAHRQAIDTLGQQIAAQVIQRR